MEGAQGLFRLAFGYTAGFSTINGIKGPDNELLKRLVEDQVKSGLPLTIILASWTSNSRGDIMIGSEDKRYSFDLYREEIEKLDNDLRIKRGLVNRPSVILLAIQNKDLYVPDTDSSIVYYRNGNVFKSSQKLGLRGRLKRELLG